MVGGDRRVPSYGGEYRYAKEDKGVDVRLLLFESVVLHTAIAEQIVNELANGEGGRVHGAKCLAVLAGVA